MLKLLICKSYNGLLKKREEIRKRENLKKTVLVLKHEAKKKREAALTEDEKGAIKIRN